MKRIAQFVAVLGIALVAVQPVLASLPCVVSSGGVCISGCPMATIEMGPDCSMQGPMAESSCPQNCCDHNAFQATAPLAVHDKSRLSAPSTALALTMALAVTAPAAHTQVNHGPRADSPPRYILNQVFRI
jgi:hypothetical protein